MTRNEHLPVYKLAMDQGVLLQEEVRKFSRYNKYSIGVDLRAISRDIIRSIVRANSSRKTRREVLSELVESCEMLKNMLVFAKEAPGRSRVSTHSSGCRCWMLDCANRSKVGSRAAGFA